MNKLLITFGLVFFLVISPCASQSSDESNPEDDDDIVDYEDDIDDNEDEWNDDDDGDSGRNDEEGSIGGSDEGDEDDGSDEDDGNDQDDGGDEDDGDDGGDGDEIYVPGGKFVESNGVQKPCKSHEDCYDQREPTSWCRFNTSQSWADVGCHCSNVKHSCIIPRKNNGELEYTWCAPISGWTCS